jgi:hypothetical protein
MAKSENFNLSQSRSGNNDLIFVKLTDSALREIEEFVKNQVSTMKKRSSFLALHCKKKNSRYFLRSQSQFFVCCHIYYFFFLTLIHMHMTNM